jgi:hypothetical protein
MMRTLTDAYSAEGWKIDDAAIRALDIARTGENRDAVAAALRAIYLPWLEADAAARQTLAAQSKAPFAKPATPPKPPASAVLIFVDGVRMDEAHRLTEVHSAKGAKVDLIGQWSGFPTATATCKPLVSPAAGAFSSVAVESLSPALEGNAVTKPVLRKSIAAAGWETKKNLLGTDPVWLELGRFDEDGHSQGARLADRITNGVAEIAESVLRLVRQDRRVRLVTDHGWLLMPGGLPHAELLSGMTVPNARGNRVALLKDGAPTTHMWLPWSWDGSVILASPPGARAFCSGTEYAHGGVNPQECVLPVIDVTADGVPVALSLKATWRRLRLHIEVAGGAGMMFDMRDAANVYGASLSPTGPRPLDDAG